MAFIVLLTPINLVIVRKLFSLYHASQREGDVRLKLVSEVLAGIRVIKGPCT